MEYNKNKSENVHILGGKVKFIENQLVVRKPQTGLLNVSIDKKSQSKISFWDPRKGKGREDKDFSV